MPPEIGTATVETTLEVHHYTDRLFRFRLSRPAGFRFRAGEFVMLGLPAEDGRPLLRAYSICSAPWDDTLEFFSIKAPDGPLTTKLQTIQIGDGVYLGRKPSGTLVLDALKPGQRLFMFGTGTGFAPFASLLREQETYEKFNQIVVFHGVRDRDELKYSCETVSAILQHEFLSDIVANRLTYDGSTTRERSDRMGRITDLIDSGAFFDRCSLRPFDPTHDRVMICGSNEMIQSTKSRLLAYGFAEGSNARPGGFVYEKAFAA